MPRQAVRRSHCISADASDVLTIRPEQMEALERVQFEAMQSRIERTIAKCFPELADGPANRNLGGVGERVKGVVERGIESAIGLDIHQAPDIAAFITLGLALRSRPGGTPEWVTTWLQRADTPGETKLAFIEKQLVALGASDAALLNVAERISQARQEASK
jgi:hypothetical protein